MEYVTNVMKRMNQNKQQADGLMTAAPIPQGLESFDLEPIAELDISFGTPLEAIDVVESTKVVCVIETEETQVQPIDENLKK